MKRLNFLKRNFIKFSIGGEEVEILEKTAFDFLSSIEIWNETNILFFLQEFGLSIENMSEIIKEKREEEIVRNIFSLHGIEEGDENKMQAVEPAEDNIKKFFDGAMNIIKVAAAAWHMSPISISKEYTLNQLFTFLKPVETEKDSLRGRPGYRRWTDEWGDVHETCDGEVISN